MPQPLLDGTPLSVHPRKVAWLRTIGLGLTGLFSLPWLLGLIRVLLGQVGPPDTGIWPVAVLSIGGIGMGLLCLRRLRRLRMLGRAYVEVHAPITRRKELVEGGAPSGKLLFHYRLDRQGAASLEGSATIAIADGGPLHADGRGNRLVVLASQAKPRLIYKLRRLLAGLSFLRGLVSSKRVKFEPGKVAFACPRCTQAMRLPVKKKGTATCPTCSVELPFGS